MTNMAELLTLLGTFVGSAFALVRYALTQNRSTTERFIDYLEEALKRQEAVNAGFAAAIDGLTSNVRENSAWLHRMAEKLGL